MTVWGRWRCRTCGRYSTTTKMPDGHRRWVGTSLRRCGPYAYSPPVEIRVAL